MFSASQIAYVEFMYSMSYELQNCRGCVRVCVRACNTLNCWQECYPVRRGKEGENNNCSGRRENVTDRKRERGQEDKQVWQVCVTVHNHHAKLM